MKKLILVRHGKSSWENPLEDLERPLKKRGYKDAKLVIEAFKSYFEKPVKAFSSNAVRALTTAQIFKEGLEIDDANFSIESDLYTFEKARIMDFIKMQDNSVEQLMLFGHNPAFTGLTNQLGDQSLKNLPTTGLVVIEFETTDWSTISQGTTLLTLFPKDLK